MKLYHFHFVVLNLFWGVNNDFLTITWRPNGTLSSDVTMVWWKVNFCASYGVYEVRVFVNTGRRLNDGFVGRLRTQWHFKGHFNCPLFHAVVFTHRQLSVRCFAVPDNSRSCLHTRTNLRSYIKVNCHLLNQQVWSHYYY